MTGWAFLFILHIGLLAAFRLFLWLIKENEL